MSRGTHSKLFGNVIWGLEPKETCWEQIEEQIENLKSMMGRSLGTWWKHKNPTKKKTSPTTSSSQGSKMDIFWCIISYFIGYMKIQFKKLFGMG
jgi:hypothetical protein